MALQESGAAQEQQTPRNDAPPEDVREDGTTVPPEQATAEQKAVELPAEAEAPPLGDWDWQAEDAADARRRRWRAAFTLIAMALISLAGLAGGLWLFSTA